MSQNDNFTKSIPVGELGIVALESCSGLEKRLMTILSTGVQSVKAST